MISCPLLAYAVELGVGADEELVAGDGDAGPDLVVSRFAHLGAVQNFAALGFEHVHFATVVLQIDFAVGCGGRAADEFVAVQIGGPEDLAGFGFAGSNGLVAAFAVHHEEFAFIVKRRGYVAGQDVFVIADLTFALPNEVGTLVRIEGVHGLFLGGAHEHDAVASYGRRHEPPPLFAMAGVPGA